MFPSWHCFFLTSATGMLLLVLRESAAMGILLRIHLGVVLGLFLTLPYGKFVHGIYRSGALVPHAASRKTNGGMQGRSQL